MLVLVLCTSTLHTANLIAAFVFPQSAIANEVREKLGISSPKQNGPPGNAATAAAAPGAERKAFIPMGTGWDGAEQGVRGGVGRFRWIGRVGSKVLNVGRAVRGRVARVVVNRITREKQKREDL